MKSLSLFSIAENKAKDLLYAKRCTGVARPSISQLDRTIKNMETKLKLSSSEMLVVMCLIHKLEQWDAEFKEHHYTTVGLIEKEDGDTQAQEQ